MNYVKDKISFEKKFVLGFNSIQFIYRIFKTILLLIICSSNIYLLCVNVAKDI